MEKHIDQLRPDYETQDLLRVARRVSRYTGVPVDVLMASITRLVATEQLRMETMSDPDGQADNGA